MLYRNYGHSCNNKQIKSLYNEPVTYSIYHYDYFLTGNKKTGNKKISWISFLVRYVVTRKAAVVSSGNASGETLLPILVLFFKSKHSDQT